MFLCSSNFVMIRHASQHTNHRTIAVSIAASTEEPHWARPSDPALHSVHY